MSFFIENINGIKEKILEDQIEKKEGILLEKDIPTIAEKIHAIDINALIKKIGDNCSELDLSEEEIEKFGDILRDNQENGAVYGRSFGAAYGGLVCICGSINCTGCYGPLISNRGLCRNA